VKSFNKFSLANFVQVVRFSLVICQGTVRLLYNVNASDLCWLLALPTAAHWTVWIFFRTLRLAC